MLDGLNSFDSCRAVFPELNIITVVTLHIHKGICSAMSHSTTRLEDAHSYSTRNNSALPIHHLAGTEENPSYMGLKLYNLPPNHLNKIIVKRCSRKKSNNCLWGWIGSSPILFITFYIISIPTNKGTVLWLLFIFLYKYTLNLTDSAILFWLLLLL